ncbi:MAG: caspase family protein [Nostoc sp.]|uniref:caspase family protein n=1 Tax=Nostoc sp. TaxID=1180 RepID=UPI002FF4600C
MAENSLKRIPFVLNALTGKELKAGNRDVSRVYNLLTDPRIGFCESDGFKPIHDCKNSAEFSQIFLDVLNQCQDKYQLIFYFSGHGDNLNNQYCLKVGVNDLDWLPFNNLINYLKMNNVTRAILILDACHSGAAIDGLKNSNNVPSIKEDDIPQGIAIIASCRKSQFSQELPNGAAGVFTELFCQAIETEFDGKGTQDGFIYVEDIVNYINHKLDTQEKYSNFDQRSVFCVHKAEKKIWIAKTRQNNLPSKNQLSESSISSHDELRISYEKTHPNRYPCPEANIDDLDLELLKKLLQSDINSSDLELLHPDFDLYIRNNLQKILSDFKLYSHIPERGKTFLHKAAVLCFCKRPERIYTQARAVFTAGNPKDSYFHKEYIEGSLSYQITTLVTKVGRYSEKISSIGKDGTRLEIDTIDLNIARELISNAIAHRDYQSSAHIKVAITSEALEVYSPGRFPSDLSWDKLINRPERTSYPVDSAIAYYLKGLLVAEGIGRGFALFQQYIKDNGTDSIVCKELEDPAIFIRVLHRSKFQVVPIISEPQIQPSKNEGWKIAET